MGYLRPLSARSKPGLRDRDARPPGGVPAGDALDDELREQTARIAKLQRVFYADARFALLIVLQGRDAAGKDGTIRHVFGAVNPQGCEVASFKEPTALEQRHDYLWRIHQRVPARGMIGIFNRSHYEDVLVERVRRLVPKATWEPRYGQINDFERMLSENGVVILKFFLHVSRGEQKRRLRDRLIDETKNWKFNAGDLEDRARWGAFTAAYRDLLHRCTTPWAPWYLVPADDKKVRNWLVAGVIVRTLERLKLRYPHGDPAILRLKIR
jgi:PPK2 family polyphosphate:nucleotide phosphotransferase